MPIAIPILLATLVGFISLSWEIIWLRAFAFATGTSPTVFGLVLSAFLAGTACGSLAAWKLARSRGGFRERSHLIALAWVFAFTTLAAFLVIPVLMHAVTLAHWGLALPMVFLATSGWGAALPVLAGLAVRPDDSAGAGVSYLYIGNIIGCVAGTLLTGFVLFDVLTLVQLAIALAFAGQMITIVIAWQSNIGVKRLLAPMLALTIAYPLIGPRAFDDIYERLQWRRNYKSGERFERVIENRSGVITVTGSKEIYGGGAYDGAISTDLVNDRNGILRAYALAGFHPNPRRVLMIGLSGGAWAQVIANMPQVEELIVIEINRGYVDLVREYPEVASLLTNPKVRIVIDDGRRWLARNPAERFDFIVSNTTFHWRANATNLLSVEHLELCRSHLSPGGILFYNTTASDDALVTGLRVFPHGFRFHAFATVSNQPIQWNGERFRSVVSNMSIDGRRVLDLSRSSERDVMERAVNPPAELIESRSEVLRRLADATTVTDDNMVTEWKKALIFRWSR